MLMSFAWYKDFKSHQTNVKSVFFNDYINKEIYVEQPSSFEKSLYDVFKIFKAFYDLKQASKGSWCWEVGGSIPRCST